MSKPSADSHPSCLPVHFSVCITSMVRLYTIKTFGLTADPTWDNVPITFWTALETTTGMLCSCLPTIRAGLLSVFPQTFGSTVHTSTANAAGDKPVTSYKKRFAVSSVAKSWPALKLTSVSSFSSQRPETQPAGNHSETLQDLEIVKLDSRGLVQR